MKKVLIAIIVIVIIVFLSILAFIVYKENTLDKPEGYDSIIVLGAQVKPDGNLSVQLQWRMNSALGTYNNYNCLIVTCGAQGIDEPIEEGVAMRNWLIQNNVPEDMVIAETESFSTYQNIENAMEILTAKGLNKPVIVTSDYHLPRSMAIASDNGLLPQGIASPTKPSYWVKNHFREVLAWCKYWLIKYTNIDL